MELSLSRTLHALVATLDRAADRILSVDFDISYSQFLTLYAVKVMDAGTQRELAAWLGTTESAVSRSVRALAVDGLASIGPSEAGGHRRSVQLTARGRELVESAGTHLEGRLAEVLAAADVGYGDYAAMTGRLLAAVAAPLKEA